MKIHLSEQDRNNPVGDKSGVKGHGQWEGVSGVSTETDKTLWQKLSNPDSKIELDYDETGTAVRTVELVGIPRLKAILKGKPTMATDYIDDVSTAGMILFRTGKDITGQVPLDQSRSGLQGIDMKIARQKEDRIMMVIEII